MRPGQLDPFQTTGFPDLSGNDIKQCIPTLYGTGYFNMIIIQGRNGENIFRGFHPGEYI